MKKLTFLFGAFIMIASVSSCKKNYTCTCSATGLPTIPYAINNSTKSDATSACTTYQNTINTSGTSYTCTVN